jgi:hypothetical protein
VSLDGPGFHVEIDALDIAARGTTQSVHDQDTFELSGLCGDVTLYGHAGVHDALMDFCVRWSDGLDVLTEDADVIGDSLTRVANAYRSVDEAAARAMTADPGMADMDG